VSGPFGFVRGVSQLVYDMYTVSSQSIGALSLSASSVGSSLGGVGVAFIVGECY
jgi:hypothetical protein